MNDYQRVNLSSIAQIIRGVTFSKADASPELKPGFTPILRSGNVQRALITDSDLIYVPKKYVKENQRLKDWDLVVSVSNSRELVGKAAILRQPWTGSFGAFLTTLRMDIDQVNPLWVYYYTQTLEWKSQISKESTATNNIANINNRKLGSIPIPVPPLSEQTKIVAKVEDLLSELDHTALTLSELYKKLEGYKESLLYSLFPLDHKQYKTSPLANVGAWFGGGTPSKARRDFWTNGNIPWVSPKDMKSPLIRTTKDHITESAIKYSSTKLVPPDAVLFVVRSGILRRTLPLAYTDIAVTLNQDMQAISANRGLTSKFVYWFCEAHKKRILDYCAKDGTTVESLDTKQLKQYPISYPASLREQNRIILKTEAAISVVAQQEIIVTKAIENSNLLRQSILQSLLLGNPMKAL